eukprot:jgi/Antlo1/1031/625
MRRISWQREQCTTINTAMHTLSHTVMGCWDRRQQCKKRSTVGVCHPDN